MEYNRKNVYTALTAKKLKKGDMVIAADNMSDLKELVKHNKTYTHIINNILLPKFEARFRVVGEDMKEVDKHLVYIVERAGMPYEPIKYKKDTTFNEDTMVSPMEFDEERLYTDLNANKLNVGDKVIAADTLFGIKSELKEPNPDIKEIVHIYGETQSYRFRVKDAYGQISDTLLAYLVEKVKPVEAIKSIGYSDYRPFNNIQELIDTWCSKLDFTSRELFELNFSMPTIWVKNRLGYIKNIACFDMESNLVCMSGRHGISYSMKDFFDEYVFLDGSPCGVYIKS